MSKLLLDEKPLLVMPALATKIGLNEAIFLQQLNYWLQKSKHVHDGRTWVYNTYEEWQEQFPFWSVSTIRRIVTKLEKNKLVTLANYNQSPIDKTKWYAINYDVLDNLDEPTDQNEQSSDQNEQSTDEIDASTAQSEQSTGQSEQSMCSDWSVHVVKVNRPIPETTTESTSRDFKDHNNNLQSEELPEEKSIEKTKAEPTLLIDDDLKRVTDLYVQIIAHNYNSITAEVLKDMTEEFGADLIELAFKHAIKSADRKITLNFIESILNEWRGVGCLTVETAKNYLLERHAAKKQQTAQQKPQVPFSKFRGNGQPIRQEKMPSWYTEEYKAEKKAREAAKEAEQSAKTGQGPEFERNRDILQMILKWPFDERQKFKALPREEQDVILKNHQADEFEREKAELEQELKERSNQAEGSNESRSH